MRVPVISDGAHLIEPRACEPRVDGQGRIRGYGCETSPLACGAAKWRGRHWTEELRWASDLEGNLEP